MPCEPVTSWKFDFVKRHGVTEWLYQSLDYSRYKERGPDVSLQLEGRTGSKR